MKLLERYALACGLQIGKQSFEEQYFSLPFDKYITVHASSGMIGKNYPHFVEVVNLLHPILEKNGIKIVQIGEAKDLALPHSHHIQGKTSLHQANYIVGRSKLHIGNDSVWAHRAGYLEVPLVCLYGPTSEENHSPYGANPDKTRLITSHRWGNKPTFASQEARSTMFVIPPEQVANNALELLGLPERFTHKTLTVGPMFYSSMLELVPNCVFDPNYNAQIPLTIRMDLEFNEQILQHVLQSGRKIHIFTNKPINLGLLNAFKQNILSYTHEVFEDCPEEYIKNVRIVAPMAAFFTREKHEDVVSRLRFKYFEVCAIQQVPYLTKNDFVESVANYLNISKEKVVDNYLNFDNLEFKSNKYVLSEGKIYLSHAHRKLGQTVQNSGVGVVIDDDLFWQDIQHYLIYRK